MSSSETLNISSVQLQNLWNESGYYLQLKWDKFLDLTGDDPYILVVWGTTIYTFLIYWIISGFYLFLDLTNKPKFLRKYKVQPGTHEPLDKKKLIRAIKGVLINQLVVTLPMSLIGYYFLTLNKEYDMEKIRKMPTFISLIKDFIAFFIINEIGFYYAHRILHMKYFYKLIHKKHHEWTAPIGLTALYSHPIEHIFSGILPNIIGIQMMGSGLFTTWLWFGLMTFETITTHSGYHLPFLKSSEFHDFHHMTFSHNYGTTGIMDWIHGTDSSFKKHISSKRNFTIWGFSSARELVPDDVKVNINGKNKIL